MRSGSLRALLTRLQSDVGSGRMTNELRKLLSEWSLENEEKRLTDNEVFSLDDLLCMEDCDITDFGLPTEFGPFLRSVKSKYG